MLFSDLSGTTVFVHGTTLSGILADLTQYLQYRVILDTSDPSNTPVLEDVAFSYFLLGIGDDDVSGRVVAESSQEFPMGTHSVIFEGLAEGVYFCAMRAGEYTATEKVVVLE